MGEEFHAKGVRDYRDCEVGAMIESACVELEGDGG
jgi:hypothetical protein